jgi:hypothetical protein
MSTPVWITPAGFLGTYTEKVSTSISVQATGGTVTYKLIGGSLPGGVRLDENGAISGTPYSVGITTKSRMVVRATNQDGVTDRTFDLDISGPTDPVWLTPPGFLKTGISSQYYSINGQFIDYQLTAIYDALPPGQKLRYYLKDLGGRLPPGLRLQEDGRIVGQIKDSLKLKYKVANSGGYDLEPYDEYTYDHVLLSSSSLAKSAKFISKVYQFNVTVTDGVSSSTRLFKIKVEDPASLRVDDTLIFSDTLQYLSDASYLLSPQWLTPTDLGYVRANNQEVLELSIYDFNKELGNVTYTTKARDPWLTFTEYRLGNPVVYNNKTYFCIKTHTSTFNFEGQNWEVNELPPYFNLDETTGALYAKLPYQPAFSIRYNFRIMALKTDRRTQDYTFSTRKFTLIIKGDIESTIEYVTNANVGTLYVGRQSELSVVAKHIGTDYSIKYRLVRGNLPEGITLGTDGTLQGRIAYDTQTFFHWKQVDNSKLIIDGGLTTFDKIFKFTVLASDIYGQSAIEQEFSLQIELPDDKKYTSIYAQPLLPVDQRKQYTTFINDSYTFDRSLIYRLEDPAFGIQQKPQLVIEHGIEQIKLDNFSDGLRRYFYRKKFYFSNVMYSRADDATGNYVYDIVYVTIVDPLEGLAGPKTFSGVTVTPNSAVNMRTALQSIQIKGETVKTDEFLLPRFMRTIQSDTGSPLGFVLVVPLCYALPGKGDTIVKRIAASNFDFRHIDFEIDRLIVRDNLTNTGAKYLLFPRKDLIGPNLGEDLSTIYGPEAAPLEPIPLYTEGGDPLELEF